MVVYINNIIINLLLSVTPFVQMHWVTVPCIHLFNNKYWINCSGKGGGSLVMSLDITSNADKDKVYDVIITINRVCI